MRATWLKRKGQLVTSEFKYGKVSTRNPVSFYSVVVDQTKKSATYFTGWLLSVHIVDEMNDKRVENQQPRKEVMIGMDGVVIRTRTYSVYYIV